MIGYQVYTSLITPVASTYCHHAVSLIKDEEAILTGPSIGAPAGGMNAATRAAARYCLAHGHTPLAVQNGFTGLMDDAIYPLTWLKVDSWMTRGGSELGTNRNVPGEDIGNIASHLQKHNIDGLFMIGGFEAFEALLELEEARKHYPQLHIPMVHLPATLSNNVPVTEFSLGSDTSLNALVDACDAIKQSASASRNRVFIVETQGGMSGYLATMGALAVSELSIPSVRPLRHADWVRNRVHPRSWHEPPYAPERRKVPSKALRT